MLTDFQGRKTTVFHYVAAAILVLALSIGQASAQEVTAEERERLTKGFFGGQTSETIELGSGSAHPCTTGEVRLTWLGE